MKPMELSLAHVRFGLFCLWPMLERVDVFPSSTARYVHLYLLKPEQSMPRVVYRGSKSSSSIKALVTGLRR